jgi:broad specificity phosphatase PhoE
MNYLILVRHSISQTDPNQPADQWGLSEEGRQHCPQLAEQLAPYRPDIIITSTELKAQETGRLVGEQLNVPVQTAANLHEHKRGNVGWFENKAEFEAQVGRFFAEPGELVFGEETADQSHQRFAQAVAQVVRRYPQQNIVIVTHGTVLSLFVGRTVELDPFSFWQRLGMPAYVVIDLPAGNVVKLVETVA